MLTPNQLSALNAPLDPDLVKVHPQTKARYLDGKHYIETANRIFGYGDWQFRILSAPSKATEGSRKNGTYYALWTVMGELTAAGATFVDVGTCEQNGDGPEATDMAMKGAVTDSLKRCLRNFGDQFGLVLYDKELSRAQMEAELAAYKDKHDEAPARQQPATFRERVNAETGEIDATAQAGGGSAVSTEAEPTPTPAGITTNFQKAIQGWLERKRLTWTNAAVLDVLGVSAATVNADGWEAPLDRWWTANGHNDGKGVVAFQKAVETRMKEMAG